MLLKTKPNKAKVNIGKMNISITIIKDYDKTTNNQQRTLFKTKPNKAKVNIGKIGRKRSENKGLSQ